MINRRLPLTVNVTVSGGTGTTTVTNGTGVVAAYAINAPSAVASYAIEILDADGYGYSGRTGNTGDITIKDLFMADGTMAFTITGTDGTYSVRVWFLY